jgi:hypothetical protein
MAIATDSSQQEMLLLLGRVDGKVDILITSTSSLAARVTSLEVAQARILAVFAVVTAFFTFLGKEHIASLFGLGGHP